MSANYEAMSDQEPKRYVLAQRDDDAAFYTYVDRSRVASRIIEIDSGEPDWEGKTVLAI